MNGRRFVTLLADIWRNLLWCGMIGAAIALVVSVINLAQQGVPANSSVGMELFSGTFVGIVFGAVFLGVPACVWSTGRWIFVAPEAATVGVQQHGVAHDASHGAMVGSAAAVPGAIIGGLGGFLLVFAFVCVVWFISVMTGANWMNDMMNNGLIAWFLGMTIGGAILGALLGMVLGGTLGAIFGGVRSAVRR